MRALAFALVFLSPPFLKKFWLRRFCRAEIHPQARLGWLSAVSARRVVLGRHSTIGALAIVRLDGELRVADYAQIAPLNLIYGSSDVSVGEHSYVGPQCLINADEPVTIGRETGIGPRSMVFTHGSWPAYTEGFRWRRMAPVTLGDGVWCAAGVFLHPGVTVGDRTVVSSCSVVSKDLPPDSVVSGNPAAVLFPVDRAKEALTPERLDRRSEEMLEEFARIGLGRELGITAVESSPGRLAFSRGRRRYEIRLLGSTPSPADGGLALAPVPPGTTAITVSTRPGFTPPAGDLWFDVAGRVAPFSDDPIHRALRLFLRRFFGVRFRDSRADPG